MASWSKIKNIIFGMLAFFCLTSYALQQTDQQKPSAIDSFYSDYPPVKQTGDPARDALIKKGEYLSKMGDCIACHTHVEGGTPPYAGRLPIETPFGTFYSPNITPDKETGIGNWTEEDFFRAMKDGRDPHGRNYFPVFPFVYFAKITDEDLKALYAYFMSIPAVHLPNKPLPFPFSIPGSRFTLWGWKLLYFFPDKEPFEYDNTKSVVWNRGKYIVDTLGHCSMCHTPLNVFGSPKQKYYLTGGFIEGYWATNITKNGLGKNSEEEIMEVFTKDKLLNNAGPVAGPMREVNHDSLKYLTPEDLRSIAVYLKTVESEEPLGVPGSDKPPTLERGKIVYRTSCDICHEEGQMSAPIMGDGPNWFLRLQENGLQALYKHAIDGYNSMPPKGACVTCSDNDIIAAVDFILNESLSRSQWRDLKATHPKAPVQDPGKVVYTQQCATCHADGSNGAPKIGDTVAWNKISQINMDILVENITKNKNHPPEGACKECTTGDVIEAIKYIYKQSDVEGDFSLW